MSDGLHRLPHGDAGRQLRGVHRELSLAERAGLRRAELGGRRCRTFSAPPGATRSRPTGTASSPSRRDTGPRAITSGSPRSARRPVDPNAALIWMELDSGATGTLARQGDPAGAAAPSFSHDGTQIVYTSTNANQDGRLGVGTADLYTVPFGDRAGGAATPVAGAADPNYAEYYPAFSPDDSLIAFNRLLAGRRQRHADRRAVRRRHVLQPGRRGVGRPQRGRHGAPSGRATIHPPARRPSRRTPASIRTRPAGTTRGPSGRPRSPPRTERGTTG